MDENYDVIILGTGLTECVISGLLATSGMKVLVMDRNDYYGGAAASLNLDQLHEKFGRGKPDNKVLGQSRKYNIDLVSKLIMANGKLVKMLQKTGVTKYGTEFMIIDGSFVLHKQKIYKVPVTEREALSSSLMGILEKRRAAKFFSYCQDYNPEDPSTFKDLNLKTMSMRALFDKFGLSTSTVDFIGHAIALNESTDFMDKPAIDTVMKIKLYEDSLSVYEDARAPYVYPLYGLGELPQLFARLCAVHGGTFMLNRPAEKIHYDDQGCFSGVEWNGEIARAKIVVGDPSYFPDKVRKVGKVIRCICLLDHTVPGIEKEIKNAQSCQIIISGSELKRNSDIYVTVLSSVHQVVPEGIFLATVSTTVETDEPEKEIEPGLNLLGPILEKFVSVEDSFVPIEDGRKDKVFISKSYDASTHFETTSSDILDLYERITGKVYEWYKVDPQEEM